MANVMNMYPFSKKVWFMVFNATF